MRNIKREKINHDILFWGAMYRAENYDAAIWFIDNVMPLLEDTDIRFIVAGNRPPEILKSRKNDRIIITGFVEDETPYFSNSLCFVSPLLTGAGIKVKIIEALSARIPVLTNSIGIEGIPAVDGESYYFCDTAEDYNKIIRNLLKHDCFDITDGQEKLLKKYFDLNSSFESYANMIKSLKEN